VLRTRLWTALVALPCVLAIVLWAPDRLFTAFIVALAAWGLYEVASVAGVAGIGPVSAFVAAGALPILVLIHRGPGTWIVPAAVILAMLSSVVRVAGGGAENGGSLGLAHAILGALYVGVLFPYFALLRNLPGGIGVIILMFLLVVATDTGAYFAGTYLGRIKLAPRVSPHKTVEGAVAGLAACLIGGWVLRGLLVPGWSGGQVTFAALMVGILAQLGDLAGSAYKRIAGVKDFGWLFPGHGGLLDRTASLVFAGVFAYYYSLR
jgi:phosphatidate cytidylyltransferase